MGRTPPASAGANWVVVHAGARDHYEIPRAFEERDALTAFVTDWYSRLDRWRLLPSKWQSWLTHRYSSGLTSDRVIDSKCLAFAFEVGRRLKLSWAGHKNSNGMLGRRAAEIATHTRSNLLSTSYYAADAFRRYRGPGRRVLFQVHPSPLYLRQLYAGFMSRGGLFEGLKAESEMTASAEEIQRWEDEVRLADRVIVASEFTRGSVVDGKSARTPTFVAPYGVDSQVFSPAGTRKSGEPLRVLFVGSKVARKGLHLLLQAWRDLRPRSATLRIAGAGGSDLQILREFGGIGTWLPRLSKAELVREYQKADLFVLPSLAEGFGHVYLESLSCGTPVIGTENSALPDLLRAGDCGFMVRAGDGESLAQRLESVLSRPGVLDEMRPEARRVAALHSWARFRSAVYRACSGTPPAESYECAVGCETETSQASVKV
jgi:glycosyltransferase involved in cell wall biosynthesis